MDILKGDAKILATKKEIRGVIVPRHDTAINWSKAVNFTPENGELIIISADNATDVARGYYLDSEGNRLTSITVNSNGVNKVCAIEPSDKVRFKFGNGKDNVNALPFQTEAIQGTARGSVILIDDVSPVTHEMGVKVRTNLFNKESLVLVTGASNLVQIDNGFSFQKTTDERKSAWVSCDIYLEKGTYHIKSTVTKSDNIGGGGIALKDKKTALNIFNDSSIGNSDRTFSIENSKTYSLNFYAPYASAANTTTTFTDVQLEYGESASPYMPYVDPTSVTVSRYGKNLFDTINAIKLNGGSNFSITNNAITVSQNGNYNYASANVLIPKSLMGKTVTISAKSNTSGANVAALRIQWITADGVATGNMIFREADSAGNIVVTGTVPIQPDEAHSNLCLMFYSNSTGTLQTTATYTATYSDIQIELGTTATDYEPYKEYTEYTPNADGTVEGVTSLYPNTTLMTDTNGVIIDCEYLTNNYTPVLDNRIPKQVQADWNQNDENANDYIKNRPGGYIDNDTIVKIPEKYLDIKNTNIVNGSKTGSLRTVGSTEESSEYTIGTNAFAEGWRTTASSAYQHVQGKYNIEDKNNTYADIIGNGSSDTKRSNAATVDWDGNAWYAGDVYVGSTSGKNKDDGSKKLATEEYTNNIINKKIEVSETAPTEEENKIWLQPITTNAGAVDYIVDEGVSGIWTYRKWNSGIAECWGSYNLTIPITVEFGYTYYGFIPERDFPTGLFLETPHTMLSIIDDSGNVVALKKPSSRTTTGVMYALSPVSMANDTVYVDIEAKGKWK